MRRTIALVMTLCVLLICVGCSKEKADIPMEKLSWSVYESLQEEDGCLLMDFTNNANYTILSFSMTYRLKGSISQEEKTRFLAALQESLGFSDAFMQDYLQKLERTGGILQLSANYSQPLQPGQTAREIKCYYMGGWTSKNLIFQELFEPYFIAMDYEKDGQRYNQTYDFSEQSYTMAIVEQQ